MLRQLNNAIRLKYAQGLFHGAGLAFLLALAALLIAFAL